MPENLFEKDPNATLDYVWDWTDWLEVGETIQSFALTIPLGLTLVSSSNTTTTVSAWVSGGTVLIGYALICRITTTDGRVDDRTLYIACHER